MSKNVEQRVVEMRFDNAQFERGISQSQASLEAFNNSLGELGGAKNGLAKFAASLKGISFNPINNGIQIGIGKLSALTAALTGVSNIADTIYNKITGTIRTLSGVDNIAAGFNKYTSATESMQSMVSAARKDGEDLADVMERCSDALSQVLWFSDETSYSSDQMTNAIAKFTNNGVALEEATLAIQGIALWAASAGVNVKKAETAFEAFSKAMGSEYLSLIKWDQLSSINFTSQKSRELILETAADLGKLTKEADKFYTLSGEEVTTANIRDTLYEKWFDKELMLNLFKQYSEVVPRVKKMIDEGIVDTASEAIEMLKEEGLEAAEMFSLNAFEMGQEAKTLEEALDSITDAASSKFQQIFQVIFGDYLEAKELFTDLANFLYDIFVEPLNDIKDAFEEWKDDKNYGRTSALNSIYLIIDSICKVFSTFKELWEEMWGSKGTRTRKILDGVTKALEKLSIFISKLANDILKNEKIIDNVSAFAEGTKNIVEALKKVVVDLFKEISKRFNGSGGAVKIVEVISNIFGWIGKLLTRLAELITDSKIVAKTFDLFDTVGKKLKTTFTVLGEAFKKIFSYDKDRTIIWQLGTAAIEFRSPLETIRDILSTIVDLATNIIMELTPMIAAVWSFIKAIIQFFSKLLTGFAPLIEKAFGMLTTGITNATRAMTDYFNSAEFTNPFEVICNVIKKIAESIGKFVSYIIDSIIKIRQANPEAKANKVSFLERAAYAIVNFAEILYAHKEAVEWVRYTLFGHQDIVTIIMNIANGLAELFTTLAVGAVVIYSVLKVFNWVLAVLQNGNGGLFSKLTAVMSGLQTIYAGFQSIMAKFANAKLIKAFAAAMISLAASLFIIALIPSKDLLRAAIVLGVALGVLAIAIKFLLKTLENFDDTIGEYEQLENSSSNVLGKFFSNSRNTETKMTGKKQGNKLYGLIGLITAIGIACLLIASSMAIIGTLTNWDTAAVAFVGFAIIIAAITGVILAIKAMKFSDNDSKTIMSVALVIVAIGVACKYIGKAIAFMADSESDNILAAATTLLLVIAAVTAIGLAASYFKADPEALKAMARLMLMVGVMFVAIALSFKIIASYGAEELSLLLPAFIVLTAIVIVIIAFLTLAMSGFGELKDYHANVFAEMAKIILNMAGLIIAIGTMIALIAYIVMSNNGDASIIWQAAGVIGALLVLITLVFGAMSFIAKKTEGGADQLMTFAKTLAVMSLSILLLVPTFLLLKDVPVDKLWITFGLIAALITLMLGASFLMGKSKALSEGTTRFSIALASLALAVLAFVPTFLLLQKLEPGQMWAIFGVIAAIVGLLVGIGALVGFFDKIGIGLMIVAVAMTIFATAGLLFGVSVLMVAFGIQKMVDAFKEFVEIGPAAGQQIIDVLRSVGEGLVELFKSIVHGILEAIKDIIDQKDKIVEYVEKVFDIIIGALTKVIPKIVNFLKNLFKQILSLLWGFGPDIIALLIELLFQTVEGLLETIFTLAGKLNAAVTELVRTALLEIIGLIGDVLPALIDGLLTTLFDSLSTLADRINNFGDVIFDALNSAVDILLIRLPILTLKLGALGSAITASIIVGMVVGIMQNIPMFVEEASKAFIEMVDKLSAVLEKYSEPVYEALVKLIEDALWEVAVWCGRMYYDLTNGGTTSPIKKICAYITAGFREGFKQRQCKSNMYQAAKFGLSIFENTVTSELDVHSPSGWMKQIGIYCMEGFAIGLKSGINGIKGVITEIGVSMKNILGSSFGTMKDSLKNYGSEIMERAFGGTNLDVMSMFSGLTEGDGSSLFGMIDMNPTITPSLDLSEVKSGASELDSMFAGSQVKSISDITDWSTATTSMSDQLSAENALTSKMQMNDLIESVKKLVNIEAYNADNPSNVNVTLAGDASKMLKLLKIEDLKSSKATGLSSFNFGKSADSNLLKSTLSTFTGN